MSLASPSTSCTYCGDSFDRYYSPGYCSEACYNRQRGEKLYNTVKHDHKRCSNCAAKLKEVEEPTDEALRQISGFHSATAVVGFQYRTPNAETGERTVRNDPGKELVATGTICGECGNANATECFPEDHDRHVLEYCQGLLDAIDDQRDAGVHDKQLDHAQFFDTFLETRDISRSLGAAIED